MRIFPATKPAPRRICVLKQQCHLRISNYIFLNQLPVTGTNLFWDLKYITKKILQQPFISFLWWSRGSGDRNTNRTVSKTWLHRRRRSPNLLLQWRQVSEGFNETFPLLFLYYLGATVETSRTDQSVWHSSWLSSADSSNIQTAALEARDEDRNWNLMP